MRGERSIDRKLKSKIFQVLTEFQAVQSQASDGLSCNDPGVTAGIVVKIQRPDSVRLAAQEGRDFELIVIHRLVHRQGRAAVDVETLRSGRSLWPLCVFRNRIRHAGWLAWRERRHGRTLGFSRRRGFHFAVITAAEPDLGKPL